MRQFKILKMFFSMCFRISPAYVVLLIVNSLTETGQILINVVLPKYLIDELLGERNINKLIFYCLLIVLSNLFFAFLAKTMKRLLEIKNMYMKEMINETMAEKIMNVSFSHLEDPYYLDLKERAVFAANNIGCLEILIKCLSDTFKNIFTILGLISIMFTLSPMFVLLLIGIVILSLFIQKLFINYQLKFYNEIIPINRKYGYYVNLAYQDKLQKDIRLFSMSKMLTDRVTSLNEELNNWFTPMHKKKGIYFGINNVLNDLQTALAYGYVGIRVFSEALGPKIGVGSLTMYASAAIQFTRTTTTLGENIMNVFQMIGYLDPYMEFMSLPDEEKEPGKYTFTGEIYSLRFEGVTFHYPKSDRLVLDKVSFIIQKGEKISIVGLNGAGKSTIVKLICRLYKPISGTIYINGHDIYDYEFGSYMKAVAAVFQDYKLFAFSIGENITCKDAKMDEDKVLELVEEVGLKEKVESLEHGILSMFGKAYDENGIEMSGGEGQKVSIARALYKKASLIILDEPTSALDPLAEAEIYEKFNKLVGNKTAIYISHRMSSSVFCDKVLVLDNGKITDFDTHSKLMEKKDGMYFKLFHSQALNYQL